MFPEPACPQSMVSVTILHKSGVGTVTEGSSMEHSSGDGTYGGLTRETRGYVAVLAVLGALAYLIDLWANESSLLRSGPSGLLWSVYLVCSGTGLLLSILLLVVALRKRVWVPRLIRTALAVQVLVCLSISLEAAWRCSELDRHLPEVTWVSVIIVMVPLLVPAPPRTTFIVSIICASTVPIGMLIVHARGDPAPLGQGRHVTMLLAPVMAASVAMFGAFRLRGARPRYGNYRTLELVGKGGRGEVWRAKHRFVEKYAAIKLVRPDLLAGVPVSRRRSMYDQLFQEANLVSQLGCPQTVNLYDFGVTDEGTLYFVMEYLDGLTLEKLVDEHGPQPPARVKEILYELMEPLAEAHGRAWTSDGGAPRRGVIHRDLKPSNVFILNEGNALDRIRVVDWGIALLDGPVEARGTPGFMPPEQIDGGHVDPRTDIYALGCTLYWLLTGRYVFPGNAQEMLDAHRGEGAPVPPSRRLEEDPPVRHRDLPWTIPPCLDDLVLTCLEKDPARRPSCVDAVRRLLDDCDVGPWREEEARRWWEEHDPRRLGLPLPDADDS